MRCRGLSALCFALGPRVTNDSDFETTQDTHTHTHTHRESLGFCPGKRFIYRAPLLAGRQCCVCMWMGGGVTGVCVRAPICEFPTRVHYRAMVCSEAVHSIQTIILINHSKYKKACVCMCVRIYKQSLIGPRSIYASLH